MVNVQIISREFIKPSSRNHARNPSKYKINVLDRAIPPIYIPLILFYPPAATGEDSIIKDNGSRVEQLKKSLSEALTRFSLLAGRINEENLVVECNDEGAEFLEARVDSHLSLSGLLQSPAVDLLSRMAPRSLFHIKSSSNVLLSIQVNHFHCGGLAVAVCMSHKLGDGHSLASFINEWASTARGAGSGEQFMGPDLASSALFPIDGYVPEMTIPPSESKDVVTKRFVFDSSKIAALRSRATGSGPKAEQPTRYEALSALIWRCLAKASADGRDQGFAESFSVHAVNLRGRMVPPLPENSFGNFAVQATVAATREELLEGGEMRQQQVGVLERKIRDGTRKIDWKYIQELQRPDGILKHMEGGVGGEDVEKDGNGCGVLPCFFTNWCRFPFYEADFGWGKPIWVTNISMPIDNLVFFLSNSSGDGIEAWVSLEEEKMAKFEQDEELLYLVSFSSINGLGST